MSFFRGTVLLSLLSLVLASNSAIAQGDAVTQGGSCSFAQLSEKSGQQQNQGVGEKASDSSTDLTKASFWWAAKQFDPFNGKLVQDWLARPQRQEINMVVNWRFWTLLDYFSRYRLVNQFGTVARRYGYNLNILNQKSQCLASYQFNAASTPPKWELNLQDLGRGSLPAAVPQAEIEP